MACRGVDWLCMARGRTIAATVVGGAKVGAPLKHLPRNPTPRVTRIVARALSATARIFRNAARLRRIGTMLLRIPISGPLPDISDHVVQPVTIGRKCSDRRGTFEAVGRKILVGKITLPGVRHMLAIRR